MGYIEDLRDKRQGAGRLRYRVRYRDPAGRERAKSFARKVDAERFLRHVEADLVPGQWVDPEHGRMTVGELAERWFATTAALKPKTREDYRSLLNNHVLPAFGERPVGSIDTLTVRGCWPIWSAGDCRRREPARLLRAVRGSGGGYAGWRRAPQPGRWGPGPTQPAP
jgi:Phage integrase, N-terminal SAM-like domain